MAFVVLIEFFKKKDILNYVGTQVIGLDYVAHIDNFSQNVFLN